LRKGARAAPPANSLDGPIIGSWAARVGWQTRDARANSFWIALEAPYRLSVVSVDATYAHLIRKLKGQQVASAQEQIERARRANGGRLVDVDAV
jgi:hypothetical protein